MANETGVYNELAGMVPKRFKEFIKLAELWSHRKRAKVLYKQLVDDTLRLAKKLKMDEATLIQPSITWRSGVGSAGETVWLMPGRIWARHFRFRLLPEFLWRSLMSCG
jgi:hypothetical protein